MAKDNEITEITGKIAVTFKPEIDIMMVTYFHDEDHGYDSGDDDDYPIIWFITDQDRVNSAEIVDWHDWGIKHIEEVAKIISQKTGWPRQPIASMLKNVSEKGKHIKPLWEE